MYLDFDWTCHDFEITAWYWPVVANRRQGHSIIVCSLNLQTRPLKHHKQASSTPFWSLNHHLKPFHFSITSIIIIFLFKIKIVWWNIPRNNGMLLLLLLLLFLFLSFYYQPLIRVVHSYVILKCVRKVHVGPSRYSPLCKKTRCLIYDSRIKGELTHPHSYL